MDVRIELSRTLSVLVVMFFLGCFSCSAAESPDGNQAAHADGNNKQDSRISDADRTADTSAKKGYPIVQIVQVRGLLPGCTSLTRYPWLVYVAAVYCPDSARPLQSGDTLVLYVRTADWQAAVKAHDVKPVLFINDIALGQDAKFSHVDEPTELQRLRFVLSGGKSSQELWTSIYREVGIAVATPAKVTVGWGTAPVFTQAAEGADKTPVQISASTETADWVAFVFASGLVGLFVFAMHFTNLFRDSTLPAFWSRAKIMRRSILDDLYKDKFPNQRKRWKQAVDLDATGNTGRILSVIQVTYATYAFPADRDLYEVLVTQACCEQLPTEAQLPDTVVALALRNGKWKQPRLTYSLARVQSGLWLLFGLVTGVFIWVVFGDFPSIGGSVVSLMAVSTVTAGASVIVDKNSGLPASYSHGLFSDLLTGPMNDAQPHRFQSVMVNLVLLAAGVTYVLQYLWYPTFDSSWLGLLGISGAALVAGKQTLETPKLPDTPKKPQTAPTAVQMGGGAAGVGGAGAGGGAAGGLGAGGQP